MPRFCQIVSATISCGKKGDDALLLGVCEQSELQMIPRNLMLIPSLACQANCAYCFGPNPDPVMSPDVFDAALEWIETLAPAGDRIELTFHGRKPLLAGHRWYERDLPLLRTRLGDRLALHLQSNHWLLDDAYCALDG